MGIETDNTERSDAAAVVCGVIQLVCAYTEKTQQCVKHTLAKSEHRTNNKTHCLFSDSFCVLF